MTSEPPPPYGYASDQTWSRASELAAWPLRALGLLADTAFVVAGYLAVFIAALILGAISSALGSLVTFLGYVAVLVYYILQLVKQGNTGQTIGKKLVGLMLVNDDTRQPIGPGMSIVRQIAHFLDSVICYIGWLFPIWDTKRQTIADKVVGTVVLTVPRQPFNAQDLYTAT